MITAFYDPGYEAPIGDHVMPMRKFALLAGALAAEPRVHLVAPEPLREEDLLLVHTAEYVRAVRTGEPRALAESQKFPWSPALYPSVLLTGGGCLAAARDALDERVAAALVSGFHHAHADHGEGFCTFNSLVVTIDRLRAERKVDRVAIVDLDLHYGNGTASLAATRPYLFNLSIYGNDYAENRPYRDVEIRRHADGPNHQSIALPNGCDRAGLLAAMTDGFERLRAWGRADLVLYQAGADPYREDPYSPLALDAADLRERDRRVFEWAREESLPIAWVLAGGYTPDVSRVVEVHHNTFRAALDVYAA
ncbi:MAG: histone deacetylase family protein [Candidatus Binatia bacterium]